MCEGSLNLEVDTVSTGPAPDLKIHIATVANGLNKGAGFFET